MHLVAFPLDSRFWTNPKGGIDVERRWCRVEVNGRPNDAFH